MGVSFERAREFVCTAGRVLERRLFATLYEGAAHTGVVAAVLAYRNDDGGFGHGLEPDKLVPDSQPLDVQVALERLHTADARELALAHDAADFLDSVAQDDGLVPIVLRSVLSYPRADHWEQVQTTPDLNPALAIAGYLHELGTEHPWLERVTATIFDRIDREPFEDTHAIHAALPFARYAPGGDRIVPHLREALPRSRWFLASPDADGYGLPPTRFPRDWFDDAVYEPHLDRLEADQQEDGGWPIRWEPPGPAAVCAWRAIWTIDALRTLETNGRLRR